MQWVHMVDDVALYQNMVMSGLPYAHTLCGRTESRKSLSVLEAAVSCPACVLVMRARQQEAARTTSFEREVAAGLDSDLDDIESMPASEEGEETSPLSILDALVSDAFEPRPHWRRWLMSPSEDPEGSLGDPDLRFRLRPDDLDLIVQVAQLADTFGASRLAARLVDVIEDLASRLSPASIPSIAEESPHAPEDTVAAPG